MRRMPQTVFVVLDLATDSDENRDGQIMKLEIELPVVSHGRWSAELRYSASFFMQYSLHKGNGDKITYKLQGYDL